MQFYMNKKDYTILRHCSVIDENPNDWFEIDEMIAEAVKLLNIKGYTTTFSCQGHLYRKPDYYGVCGAYVAFENIIDINDINPPDGWYIDKENGNLSIRHDYTKYNNHNDAITEITFAMLVLYAWAEELPEADKDNVKLVEPELHVWNATCNTPDGEVCYGAICETPDEAVKLMLDEIAKKQSPLNVSTNMDDYELDLWGSMPSIELKYDTKDVYESGLCTLYNCDDVQIVVKRVPATPDVNDKCVFFIGGR